MRVALSLVCAVLVAVTLALCPSQLTEKEVLEEIYTHTNGPYWTQDNNWLSVVPYCYWTGVTCNKRGQISGLDLTGFGLTGDLPSELGCLPYLKTLVLSDNNLTSTIPSSIGYLSHLQEFYAESAGLTGPIPSSVCDLEHIMKVHIGRNSLTGSLPECMYQMEHLLEWHSEVNALSGAVPLEIERLEYLTELHLQCNPDLVCTSIDTKAAYLCGVSYAACTVSVETPGCAICMEDEECGRYCAVDEDGSLLYTHDPEGIQQACYGVCHPMCSGLCDHMCVGECPAQGSCPCLTHCNSLCPTWCNIECEQAEPHTPDLEEEDTECEICVADCYTYCESLCLDECEPDMPCHCLDHCTEGCSRVCVDKCP
ncbi:hypothetical protein KIPB_009039 [Kipferlia bialata]|uniref:Leucine-rich repeat-containing N-terminal plant-type domain-containing protein n=1 Tax=Kipferlia bialata TaxID=797122 RepID=A0A9K3GLU0_9EUKA|nr:hypothetical protein KIPB_009039 [Kipferlia bialata]|eukprot:g9039.t1